MNGPQRKRVVIVDGYSTGRDLVLELLGRNVECLHLRSTRQLPASVANSFNPAPYDADLGFVGDAKAAAAVLDLLAPDAVIAGSEWGVTFAELVASGMGLPTNRIETIRARRDKFEMIEALHRHGVYAARQARVRDVNTAQAWAERHGNWPIVVKPPASAGSDGVYICRHQSDIARAVASELGRKNFVGCRNDSLLVQSYLPGPQFIVNAVSHGGRHYVTDVWRQTTAIRGSAVVPSHIDLLDPREPRVAAMIEYTHSVLAALGIENGASHSELKWTSKGAALIETGARLMGAAMDSPSYRFARADSQAMVYALVLTGTDTEREELFARRHYAPKRQMTKLLFEFQEAAEIRGTDGLDRLCTLPSFHAHYRPLDKGARVWKTADWLCCGGVVYLVHDDPDQIASDIDSFRTWERRGQLYDLEPIATKARVS
jgi:ATP-grasp domain-containing protein